MTALLVSHRFSTAYGAKVAAAAARDKVTAELLALPPDPVDELHPPQALRELLPRCDWLIIACPLTPETRGLVDAGLRQQ